MDSLTQMVLGAAVAEAALGKKVGNRAMVWGAIAGTIPDLDVIANFFMEPVDALAFHRGPTHSALYCTLLAVLMGILVHRMYRLPYHRWFGAVGWSLLMLLVGTAIIFAGGITLTKAVTGSLIIGLSAWTIMKRYHRPSYDTPQAGVSGWIWMFFLALVTHPILDCFTTYGTQILLPFSDRRVAFNNISVADPAYTMPFLTCLIIAMFYSRTDRRRHTWVRRGLIISSAYMIFTFFNKSRVNTVFENSLSHQKVNYTRYMTTPTILNNILWSGIAETDSAYYYGSYSFFDSEKEFKLTKMPKDRTGLETALTHDPTLKTMRWFSDDFFALKQKDSTHYEYYDLRFGTFRIKKDSPDQFVFRFNMIRKPDGSFYLKDQGDRPRDADFSEAFPVLWDRIKGKTQAL